MRIKDGWFRVSTIVLPSLLMVYGVFSNPGPRAVDIWVALVFILSTCLLCEGNRLIIYRSRSWFGKNGWQRRFLVLLTGIGFSSLVLLTGKVVRNLIRYGEPRWQGE